MCGIFGYLNNNKKQDSNVLKKMAFSIKHRGPDGEGFFQDEFVSSGMVRLSIIDLSTGDQPFYNADKSIIVFCNGEIYNYIELREELKKQGYFFKTNSDIEVIAFLYEKYGIDFVNRLNGMYAISLYDQNKGEFFLIRDRLGVKPIYFYRNGNEFVYASELKAILEYPNITKKINYAALSSYFDLLYIPTPLTPFENIHKLPSASYLKVKTSGDNFEINKYWDLDKNDYYIKSEKEIIEKVDSLFKDSISLQMRSDVPVGSYLSGGIDSSAIVSIASRIAGEGFSTFHLNWSGAKGKLDESKYARDVATQFNTTHYEQSIGDEALINSIPKLIWHLDEPHADAAFAPTYSLAKLSSEKVKVILSGAGGDELFAGYNNHLKPNFLKRLLLKTLFNKDTIHSTYDRWKTVDQRSFQSICSWYQKDIFRKEYESLNNNYKKHDWLNQNLISDIHLYLQDDILILTDKMTMAASIECRVPFLDHRLVELSVQIPEHFKIKNQEKKYILKQYLKGNLSDEILYRKKEGFGVPVDYWIQKYKAHFDRIILDKEFLEAFITNKPKFMELVINQKLTNRDTWIYWKLFVLCIWFKIFIKNEGYDSIAILS